ncbi:ABC transporter ATP-binding protein [Aurantimonas sp. C2-6-R+9]|uniref:ABC transporter ATP-binding protein n=1 Tax=unclassified Aurantimonas TaxID=2638230 RepID=UPI002E18D1AA|nr:MULTISPECIES: ABC transporter ATP-binding protein [unclassified Aurantimonas]MEC5293089.1 ABC transporter ATP-binding protein [Aurantimonas sp. C2-3-R2]MEC5383519.1 ABC transporter ATP-binding protein [Aurantimonas sp. C2-6-R+9]MEC5414148.1 ABC transporter ATP-binding protein [Aurantimonas sp. C2-4-R8]
MLRVEGLTVRVEARTLVTNFSCELREGRITCLIGPSGCGKTSVLKWLAGILPPGIEAKGRVTLDGAPILRPHPSISYQPQSDALFPWLTVTDNAALGLEMAGLPRRAAREKVADLFVPFGLSGCEDLYPDQVSGGMRQRAAFLRTIVQDSRFVLLDEPFSALDAVTRLRMQDWLCARLAETLRGVLMVTHDLHEATQMADHILVMSARPGPLVADIPITTPRERRSEVALAEIRTTLRTLLLKE